MNAVRALLVGFNKGLGAEIADPAIRQFASWSVREGELHVEDLADREVRMIEARVNDSIPGRHFGLFHSMCGLWSELRGQSGFNEAMRGQRERWLQLAQLQLKLLHLRPKPCSISLQLLGQCGMFFFRVPIFPLTRLAEAKKPFRIVAAPVACLHFLKLRLHLVELR